MEPADKSTHKWMKHSLDHAWHCEMVANGVRAEDFHLDWLRRYQDRTVKILRREECSVLEMLNSVL